MSVSNRLRVIVLSVIAFSVYIGIEIDYRHWTWVLFLIAVPVTLAASLVITRPRKSPEQRATRKRRRRKS